MIARKLALLALLVVPLLAWGDTAVPPPPVRSAPPKAMPAQSSERMKMVTYSVADLVVPIFGLDYPEEKREEEESKTKEAWLLKKITTTVASRTWSGFGGSGTIQYYPLGKALVVNQTPEVHAKVAELLVTMRRAQNIQVSLELRWLEADDATFARLADSLKAKKEGHTTLSDIQLFMLLEAIQGEKCEIVQAPKVTIISGQRSGYLINEIMDVKLGAMVAGNLRHIDVDLKGEVHHVKFKKAARLVDGDTLVLSGRKENGKPMILLVTPRVVIDVDGSAMNCEQPKIETAERTLDSGVVQASATIPNKIAVAPAKLSSEKQWVIKIGIYEGDPLGSREANTIRTIGEPTIMAPENQTFAFTAGVQAPIKFAVGNHLPEVSYVQAGLNVEGKVLNVKDGLAQIDLTISLSKLDNRGEENVRVHGESTRAVTRVKLGDLVKIRVGRISLDQQRWVELRVTEVPEPSVTAE